ncbi:phage tail tape measure protein [Rhodoferax fermentans]|uniref:Phage tail tape measure protein n=1 Tax=Rhodoferax fermentans TaxID=28066 RepID=A0A1T1AVS0_RHOFE|nr:phage tail tape measure protein [Rhodoferax fermentans]MBK1685185.1 phage tail tape measure protein [Rhodoferax fermentans]OOV08181.1 phage tail tape measure protein [Rhodoferax fermentans]
MANAQTTIDLIFNGVDRTGAATVAALDNARKFSGSVRDITEPIASFTTGAVKLEAGILAAGVAMTVFAVKTAGDFDSAFRQISTIIDASDEDLAGFKAAILDYAQGSTQPLEQITNALANAIGSGVDWAQSLDLISVAEKLAVATRSDLDSTTKVLVSTLNSYGLEIADAGKVSDLFFKIIDEGDISMGDLAASFAKVAPIAKISGVSLEEVGAAIATLTASGIKPAESIEYLRGAINNIISPSKQGADLAAELGINFNAAGLKAQGLAGLLAEVALKTGGSADKMKILFGDIGGFTAAATLAGPQAEKFAETLKAMGDVAGATDAAFAKVSGSLEVSGAKIANAFTALLVSIGSPLLDEFGGVANAIAGIFSGLADSARTGGLKDLVTYVESQMAGLQAAVERVAKNLPAALASADFSGFKGGIDAVITSVKALFGGLDLTSVDGLRSAIETMGAAFLGLSLYVSGVVESFKPLFDTLVAVGSGAKDADLSFLSIAGSLGGLVTQLNIALPLFDVLIGVLAAKSGLGLAKELTDLSALLPALTSGLGLVAKAGALAGAGMAGYELGGLVNEGISALISKITGSENTLGTWIYNMTHADEAATALGASTTKAATKIEDMSKATSGVAGDFSAANQAMLDNFAASEKAAEGSVRLTDATKDASKYVLATVPIYDKATGAITGYEQKLVKSAAGTIELTEKTDKASTSLDAIAEKTKKAEEAQARWNLAVMKMNSDEKIAEIASQTKIATAQIEADAKKTVAAYESLNETIKDTSKSVANLFGLLITPNAMDWATYRKLQDETTKESQRRDEAMKLQKDLTTTQIDLMKAQIKAFENGNAMIKINGDGLQPHLEAFMWEILKSIQVRVNKDGMKMLLGA